MQVRPASLQVELAESASCLPNPSSCTPRYAGLPPACSKCPGSRSVQAGMWLFRGPNFNLASSV
eukprot:1159630-Pelagomonas_calceolata.AAC.1